MKVDTSDLLCVRGADGGKIQVGGSSSIFLRDSKSPSWRKVKIVITRLGSNFLLSNSNLKNLQLLSPSFPNYIGVLRKEVGKALI